MCPVRQKKNRCGTAVVEMAIVMPLFVCLLFASIESARLGMVSQLITTAAREACRVAVLDGNTNNEVNNQITATFNTMGITGYTTTITPADCTSKEGKRYPGQHHHCETDRAIQPVELAALPLLFQDRDHFRLGDHEQ